MAITLKDVAAKAKVHPSTVSRVLRGSEHVPISSETRKRILKVAKELNYHPDKMARALRLRKSNTIGLIIPDISNPFFSEIAKSIEKQSFEHNYSLIVCSTNEDQEKEIRFVNDLISRGIDGLILAPVQDKSEHIQVLVEKQYPFVLIDRRFNNFSTNAVISDNAEAAYNAVKILDSYGHKRIAFLCGRQNIFTIQKRLKGYNKALTEFNLCTDSNLVSGGGHTFESGYEATKKLLNIDPPPTALLVSGNMISFGALKAIYEKKLLIPDQISIIGFVDNILTPYLFAPLTTVSHPLDEMGKKAFLLLRDHMESKDKLSHTIITVKTILTNRNSIGPLKENYC